MGKLFFTVLLVIFSCKAAAQVTIGSLEEPNRAALLDLKSNAPSFNNATTDVNGGGLQLPRVYLTNKETLEPFIPTTDSEWLNNAADLKKKHVGLEVYNLTVNNDFKAGVYYWDGSRWQSAEDRNWTIGGNKMNASESILGTLSNDSLCIVSNGNKKIILGKNNGEVYLRDLPQAPVKGTVPIQINKKGQVFAVLDDPNDYETKPFTYIKFTIYTDTDTSQPGRYDWVSNFNTKVDANRFVMTIIGSAFQHDNSANSGVPMKVDKSNGTFGTAQIYAFPDNGTWRIRADYAEASPADATGITFYKWLIYVLVVNKSMISNEYDIQGKISNGTTGEAGQGVDSKYDTPTNLR